MERYYVGQVIESFVGHSEETVFDMDDDGAFMLVFFNNPKEKEIKQFETGVNFEIRYNLMYNIIMITTKIGDLNWMDAPYDPHLSLNLTKIEMPGENQGLSLLLILIDCSNGEIKAMRFLGLGEKFSKKLLTTIGEVKMSSFNYEEYKNNLKRIFNYSTKQIVGMSRDYCKLNC